MMSVMILALIIIKKWIFHKEVAKMERAMIIVVSNKEWAMPKSILMDYKGNSDRLDAMAKELFEEYKAKENVDVVLLDYTYYGKLIIEQ